MSLERYCSVFVVVLGLLFGASCEKAETPVAKPPKGNSLITRVDMGDDYANQIFFNFSTGQVVMTSKYQSWDLSFEASENGYHIFMNGGKDVLLYNTHITDPTKVTEANAYLIEDKDWGFDASNGLPDGSYVANWTDASGAGKGEVFIIRFNDLSYKKIVFSSVNDSSYTFSYGDINSNTLSSFTVFKNPSFNFSYFSFDGGGKQVYPDPPKNTWDIVFTRYRYIYKDLENYRYVVTGVLLNPHNTSAMVDSSTAFADVVYVTSAQNNFSNNLDVIGFDWKDYNFNNGVYETNPKKCYVIKTQQNEYWKLRFVDFYSSTGVKGSPSFEFQRIQ